MSDARVETFETPGPTRLRIGVPKGRIHVSAEGTTTTRVELVARNGDGWARDWIAAAEVARIGDEIVVRGPRPDIGWLGWGLAGHVEAVVTAPVGSAADLSTGAGRIETSGRLGDVAAQTGSGGVRIAECAEAKARTGSGEIEILVASGSVDARTGSGRISAGKVGGDAHITTGSGSAVLGEVAGQAKVTTGSGNIDVDKAGDGLEAFTPSGAVKVRSADHGQLRARTIAGGVQVGVAKGAVAHLDVSTMTGRVHSELEPGPAPADGEPHLDLMISTMTGNVHIARA